ncbi:MAG: hypothetical protein RLZZ200_910 [Pseudomonadota bacterium]|jgi:hypothetical protein
MTPPGLEFAFRVLLRFDAGPRLRFEPAFKGGRRGFVAVAGGEISGPRLSGRVLPRSGGDWPLFWAGGLVDFEAHYQLEADDGTPIYIHNRGIAYSAPEVLARIEAGDAVLPEETYCRVTPRFEAPVGPHDWLNRTLFVGKGERRGAESLFDYYAVT